MRWDRRRSFTRLDDGPSSLIQAHPCGGEQAGGRGGSSECFERRRRADGIGERPARQRASNESEVPPEAVETDGGGAARGRDLVVGRSEEHGIGESRSHTENGYSGEPSTH